MKKLSAVLLIPVILLSMLLFTGCESSVAHVESTLSISPDFSGSRKVDVVFPLSVAIDDILERIKEESPCGNIPGAEFEYLGVEEGGYRFELTMDFADRASYIKMVSKLINREPTVFLSQKDTPLTKGVRMYEDFGSAELIEWIERIAGGNPSTENVGFDYSQNAVNIGSEVFATDEKTDITSREGQPVNAIYIATTNSKNELFDRTITFSMPNSTYQNNKNEVTKYFDDNTPDEAQYADWTAKGESMEYTVIFHGLGIEVMRDYTAMLLDTANESVIYDDRDNASTPLTEGLSFEESFDTFSFIGPDGGAVPVGYSYALPTVTTYGDGSVLRDGVWKTEGVWTDGVYNTELDLDAVRLRIPDGIQYAVTGIDFRLESLAAGTFRRVTDFRFSKADGRQGFDYAKSFFKDKGAQVEDNTSEEGGDLILSVICEGTSGEITDLLVDYFGSGNFMSYEQRTPTFSLSTKTAMREYINLSHMLNAENAAVPMTYSVVSSGNENITEVHSDSGEKVYISTDDSQPMILSVSEGVADISYSGNIPIMSRILIYSIVGALLLGLTGLLAVVLFRKGVRRIREERRVITLEEPDTDPETAEEPAENESDEPDRKPAPSLAQTTTFSILELGILAKNKKYVDEINKDIEERIEQDRLDTLKKEIKQKELEEMERMVYGNADEAEPEETPASEEAPAPEAAADTENTAEDVKEDA